MKILKLNSYTGENIKYFYAAILVDYERLESTGSLNTDHLGYIICIFEDTSDSRSHIWEIQKHKEVTEFTKNIFVCDVDVISTEHLITYEYLVQEATHEYHNLVN